MNIKSPKLLPRPTVSIQPTSISLPLCTLHFVHPCKYLKKNSINHRPCIPQPFLATAIFLSTALVSASIVVPGSIMPGPSFRVISMTGVSIQSVQEMAVAFGLAPNIDNANTSLGILLDPGQFFVFFFGMVTVRSCIAAWVKVRKRA